MRCLFLFSPRKRSDSVFSAEEGPTTSDIKPTQAPVAASPVTTGTIATETSAMAKDKKEKKKKEEKERDEAEGKIYFFAFASILIKNANSEN